MNNMRTFKIIGVIFSVIVLISVIIGFTSLQFLSEKSVFNSFEDFKIFMAHETGFMFIIAGFILALCKKYKEGKVALLVGTLILFIYSIVSTQLNDVALNTVTSNSVFFSGLETIFSSIFTRSLDTYENVVIGAIVNIAVMAFGIYGMELMPWQNSKKQLKGKI